MNAIGPACGDYPPSLLDHAGAVLWWYVDLVDGAGNGAVCIWSWGLPFLPGVASAARRGRGFRPRERPSVNVAVYREGRPDFYVLREFRPEECAWQGSTWTFGRTTFARTEGRGRLALRASFDLDLSAPRARVQGDLMVEGPLRSGPGAATGASRQPAHSWEPLTLGSATGRLELRSGSYRASVEGRAYHDRNGGSASLAAAGLTDWRWGRFALPGEEIVFTALPSVEDSLVLSVDAQGRATRHAVHAVRERRLRSSWMGPRWPLRVELDTDRGALVVEQTHLVDSSPFYQRALGRATIGGESGPGIAERVLVDRLDPWWMRPLVRMRVDRGAGSSPFLGLFNGPRARPRRLPGPHGEGS